MGETILDLYWGSLLEFDFQDIELAAASHLKDDDRGRFMPKIADFVYAIEGSADEAAAIAWDAVLRGRGEKWMRLRPLLWLAWEVGRKLLADSTIKIFLSLLKISNSVTRHTKRGWKLGRDERLPK